MTVRITIETTRAPAVSRLLDAVGESLPGQSTGWANQRVPIRGVATEPVMDTACALAHPANVDPLHQMTT